MCIFIFVCIFRFTMQFNINSTFFMYALTMFGESLGQRGVLPPIMAAWGPDVLLLLAACMRLYIVSIRR